LTSARRKKVKKFYWEKLQDLAKPLLVLGKPAFKLLSNAALMESLEKNKIFLAGKDKISEEYKKKVEEFTI